MHANPLRQLRGNDRRSSYGGVSTMMNRRQLVCAGAAGVALLARVPKVFAAPYDLIIKGGRVIDPSVGLDALRDVAIAGGKIAAVETDIAGDAAQTIDAGSAGADNIDEIAAVARGAPQIGRALVNISRVGVAQGGELHDLNRANVALAQGAIARHRDV